MLFGEHAVVYGRPCIVTAVNQRMKATVELTNTLTFELQAPDVQIFDYKKPISDLGKGEIPKAARFVEFAVKNFLEKYPSKNGITILTESEFSSAFGFGSSSAATVCVLKALSELLGIELANKELFDISYKTILDVQKKGSGFDVAAAIYGGTLYFVTGGKVIEPLNVESLPLLVGYSGIKADTVTIMNQVVEKTKNEQYVVEGIYNKIAILVDKAKEAIIQKDWKVVGKLMNRNQSLLQQLGVSTEKLDVMIDASLSEGAIGAKLSGAGGGDCMISLCLEENKKLVTTAINKVGGRAIDVSVNTEGVRIES